MTIDELRELTDFPFEGFAMCGDPPEEVMFAAPIPPPYGNGLHWHKTDSGSFGIDDNIELWWDAWEQYISSLKPKRKNRTRKQAANQGAITEMPNKLAIITLPPYQNAMTPVGDKAAHLQPIMQTVAESLQQDYESLSAQGFNFVQFYDNSPQAVSNLDLITLRAIYSIFLAHLQGIATSPDDLIEKATNPSFTKESIKIYIPDFLKMTGLAPNHSKSNVNAVLNKIASYSAVYGVLVSHQGGREYRSHYPVLQLVEHNDENNTVEIMSPYINKLIGTIVQASIKKDRNDKPKLKRNGTPFTWATHSYMVDLELAKERNKRAAEIVCRIVDIIEECGNGGTPHIKVKTLIERVPDLENALNNAKTPSDKSKILRRAFSKAWQLLETKTKLRECYKNIQFPTLIPTPRDMDKLIEIPHEGKTKEPETAGPKIIFR